MSESVQNLKGQSTLSDRRFQAEQKCIFAFPKIVHIISNYKKITFLQYRFPPTTKKLNDNSNEQCHNMFIKKRECLTDECTKKKGVPF